MEKVETSKMKKINLNEYHSKIALEKLRKKYQENNEEIKFILPNGKEV